MTDTTKIRITGPHKNRLKWGVEVYENHQWVEIAATEGNRRDAERLKRDIQKEREMINQPPLTTKETRKDE